MGGLYAAFAGPCLLFEGDLHLGSPTFFSFLSQSQEISSCTSVRAHTREEGRRDL